VLVLRANPSRPSCANEQDSNLSRVPVCRGTSERPRGHPGADDPESAIRAVEQEHAGETSYGVPYVITEARPYEPDSPTVIIINYG
jgi:hypothetical protein